jgi:L-ascorbate metabolism protein UlaG (beta-lactamase superfamily)
MMITLIQPMTLPPSDHFNGKTFFYPGSTSERGFRDLLRWKLMGRPARWPEKVSVTPVSVPPAPRGDGVTITWIGHATFLLQMSGSTWLTDPVFSDRIGPIKGLGPRRVASPAISLADLPKIDGVLLSHDHYDHCDLASLRALVERNAALVVVAPLNYVSLLKPARGASNLVELDWWQSWEGPGNVSIELVPARHWCRRSIGGMNTRLWGGFFLRLGGRSVYFAGDSGYDAALFQEIARRCGLPDVALLPIGAYEPRWFMNVAHMNPATSRHAAASPCIGAPFSSRMKPTTPPPRLLPRPGLQPVSFQRSFSCSPWVALLQFRVRLRKPLKSKPSFQGLIEYTPISAG